MQNDDVSWFLDRWSYFCGILFCSGWAFHAKAKLRDVKVYLGPSADAEGMPVESELALPSADVAGAYGKIAQNSRFRFIVRIPDSATAEKLGLMLVFANDEVRRIDFPAGRKLSGDAYHAARYKFFKLIADAKTTSDLPKKVVEIGARARSGNTVKDLVGSNVDYVGFDILPGENVDMVGDAHLLSSYFPHGSVDAVFSVSVFEHLLMPWKVAVEINHVLRPGGLVLAMAPQSFPLHDVPWDFWRFSDQAWHGLFNEYTGFQIVHTAVGEPVDLVANMLTPVTSGFANAGGYAGTAVIAKKVGETNLSWAADTRKVVKTMYPQ